MKNFFRQVKEDLINLFFELCNLTLFLVQRYQEKRRLKKLVKAFKGSSRIDMSFRDEFVMDSFRLCVRISLVIFVILAILWIILLRIGSWRICQWLASKFFR